MKQYMVLDIGGSAVKFALMDKDTIHSKGKRKTPRDSLESLLFVIEKIVQPYTKSIAGLAVSMPGRIDSAAGFVGHGGSLTYNRNTYFARLIEERVGLPVRIENDGKSAALGEFFKGGLKGVDHGVGFVLGTGVGGGIIANGQLVKGHHFSAGEFSFIRMQGKDPLNPDGFFGRNGSTTDLVRRVANMTGADPEEFEGQDMFKLIREGNQKVQEAFTAYCTSIAGQIMNLQGILDPEVFVIGGGMSAEPMLTETIEKALDHYYEHDPIYAATGVRAAVKRSELGNDANLYGALYHFLDMEDHSV
ncbi:Sugar kinase and transcription regulator [Alkalibacterium sp. AK22]|uniref:ROK family protein n=1 Tax=Alkalibacterium sp. AK22 TaxID=1229520 RepID=UPI00045069A5|nr:ROK family protein [Alkalibacterium sp. AK22]EXJ23875.1 Sugar kinase and transcription regulator [Alkalibacterium sp. AK22]